MAVPILDPNDPGLYRVQRGVTGSDAIMQGDAGPRGRTIITTGETVTHDAADWLPGDWRRLFDPRSAACAALVLGLLVLLLHARADVAVRAAVRK
jgi:hypothetical protein